MPVPMSVQRVAGRSSRKSPQWFCCHSRSGLPPAKRTQCESCPYSMSGLGWKSARTPWFSGCQSAPPSTDSIVPPLDMLTYMWRASRGSTRIECSLGPSGVPSWSPPHHALRIGCALKPATPSHVAPPSAERNRPCGDVPAHQTPGCDAWPGVSQNVWSTTRPLSGANAGGVAASFHVRPPSVERNTVGPRWPVRAAASSVLPSRGSSTAWWTVCPRNAGPASFHVRRVASPVSVHRPLRVAISRRTRRGAAGRGLAVRGDIDGPPEGVGGYGAEAIRYARGETPRKRRG